MGMDGMQDSGEPTSDVRVGARHGGRDAPVVHGGGVSAFLYDVDGDDRDIAPDEAALDRLREGDLLWVDVDSSEEGAVARIKDLIPVEIDAVVSSAANRPFLRDFGESFVLGVLPLSACLAEPEPRLLICAVGRNWLVTVHRGDVGSLEGFADHLRGDSSLGRLDAPSFLARLLEWFVNAYLDYLDDMHDAIDTLEETILRNGAGDDVITRLVDLRHDTSRLRRRLSPHRQVFATLSHPGFHGVSGSSAAREFEILADRLEMTVQAVHATSETIVGAFDLVMTRTAQRTNNGLRVLTAVSLILLPAAVIASTLGMNMVPQFMLHAWVFWAGFVLMLLIGAVVLVTMRMLRRWL